MEVYELFRHHLLDEDKWTRRSWSYEVPCKSGDVICDGGRDVHFTLYNERQRGKELTEPNMSWPSNHGGLCNDSYIMHTKSMQTEVFCECTSFWTMVRFRKDFIIPTTSIRCQRSACSDLLSFKIVLIFFFFRQLIFYRQKPSFEAGVAFFWRVKNRETMVGCLGLSSLFKVNRTPRTGRDQEFRPKSWKSFDFLQLAQSSESLSGAEIRQSIIEGMYHAFYEKREFTTDDICSSVWQ